MQLQLATQSETLVRAGYLCTCGCKPSLDYERGAARVEETCCCGTHFVVGPEAETHLNVPDGLRVEVQEFTAPWGETIEAAWAIGSGTP